MEPSVGPDAAEAGGRARARGCEVDRATRLHGRTCPGGMGETGRGQIAGCSPGARQAKQEAIADGVVSFCYVLEEEIAEVWASRPGRKSRRP